MLYGINFNTECAMKKNPNKKQQIPLANMKQGKLDYHDPFIYNKNHTQRIGNKLNIL